MTILFALALSIGGLAFVATWLLFGPLAGLEFQVWQAFIAWGCFYHCGGKIDGLKKTVICMIFGAIVGAVSVMGAGLLGVPLAVGIGAAVLVLAAHVGLLSTIPASVYGFAAIAGLILLKGLTPVAALVPTIASIVLGAIFGWLSETIGGKLTKSA